MSTKELVKSEVEDYAKFDIIRYAQVWEDAEILIEALKINENDK
jgi:S-adenosylmethionine:diacylglycerol 3-amino-3-carboxypropyl transferase